MEVTVDLNESHFIGVRGFELDGERMEISG